jgi:drug/metabolite transporter (DMT)-like permease
VVASALSYSLFAVFTEGLLDDLDPTDILFWRFSIAVPAVWVVVLVRARRGGPGPRSADPFTFMGAGLVFGLLALFAFVSLDHLSASLYTVLIYTYPAMVAVGSALLGARPPRAVWFAIGLTSLGIAFTVPELFKGRPDADLFGLVLCLGNAALYAAYLVLTGRLIDTRRAGSKAADGVMAGAWSLTGSLGFAITVALIVGVEIPDRLDVVLALAGLAIVSTVIASVTLFVGMKTLPAHTAATIATLEPVLTLVWAVTLLDESLVALQAAGAVLVLGGVVWAQRATT